MKKVAISIPVHQSPACIEDQVANTLKFVPNCVIILHVSGDDPQLLSAIERFKPKYEGALFINPHRYTTFAPNEAAQVSKLSSVHASNIQYITSIISDLDIMAFETSNDLFVRKGIQNTFEQFDWGCGNFHYQEPDSFPSQKTIEELKMVSPIAYVCKAAQEGFWCNMGAAKYFAQKVKELEVKLGILIGWEEGTLANLVINSGQVDLNKNSQRHYVYHDPSEGAAVARPMIHRVRNGELPHVYSVKRVPRNIKDSTRRYIRGLTKND